MIRRRHLSATHILVWPAYATNGNDLDAAEQHGQQSLQLARQIENTDRFVASELFLARLKLAQGDVAGAASILAKASHSARQHNFVQQIPEVMAVQVLILIHQENLAAAAELAQTHELPISQARVHLAQRDPSAAVAVLEPLRQQVETKGWADERLKVMALQAVGTSDLPVLVGTVLFAAFVIVFMNIVTDVVYSLIDPRVRLG